ncbi:alpha/beta fold hydrolase [Cupriavidus necator]|uniref:alpha/beta hydrolase n=1 Tax=Cupriavidus necator TaxID=106590 RepID=UPI00339D67D9
MLLPGHGTRPEDLLDVTLEDWQRVVQEQADALRRDVAQVYLGGFSTGANLALDYAYAHPDVAGLVLFSPADPLYGEQGSLRICWNGQDEPALMACERGEPVWYSDWGYREAGKVHARLTFNPYFDWQGEVIAGVMGGSDPHAGEPPMETHRVPREDDQEGSHAL